MVQELVDKYIFLLQTFMDAGEEGLSLEEISSRWEARYGSAYPRRSFANHREAVSQVFGVEIACNRSTNRYYIDSARSTVDKREATEYLVNLFTVNSLLAQSREKLIGRVSVENIPSGANHLLPIMQAMLDGEVLRITYRKYMSSGDESRTIRPYAVKEFEKRWYVVAYSKEADALRVFALDRVSRIEKTGGHFRMPGNFDVEDLFIDSYGIYLPEGEPARLIRLKCTKREAAYLKDLPLHPSQVLEKETDTECIFALRLIPNTNFIMDLCKRGGRIEVLEPESLRTAVIQELKMALNQYEKV